jgi:formylglycine-generating enzyme
MGPQNPKPTNPNRRSFLSSFFDPDKIVEYGRALGRAVREYNEAVNPPSVPLEVYLASEARVVEWEAIATKLQAELAGSKARLHEPQGQLQNIQYVDEATLQKHVKQAVEEEIAQQKSEQTLERSGSVQDKQQLKRWVALRKRLRQILETLLGLAAITGALRDAWVQEEIYPLLKAASANSLEWLQSLIETLQSKSLQPTSPIQSPPESPLPEPPEPKKEVTQTQPASINFDWVRIPAGPFFMGSDRNRDPAAFAPEMPGHQCMLQAFYIARVPVTVAQFAAFIAATQYHTTAETKGFSYQWGTESWYKLNGAYWKKPRGPHSDIAQRMDHPVTCVSWYDAIEFCRWAGVRLPTEAEWEKAARGSYGRLYPWGSSSPDRQKCNFNNHVANTSPVGKYAAGANPFGMLDMAGNVSEWTSSKSAGYPYKADDGREQLDGDSTRIVRSGSFEDQDFQMRCAARFGHFPYVSTTSFGFRVVYCEMA